MIDVAPLVPEYATSITIEVYDSPTASLGRVTYPVPTEVELEAPAHPTTSRRMLARLPEADRYRETIAVYLTTAQHAQIAGSSRPPVVQLGGRRYEVSHTGDYGEAGEVFLLLASLIDEVES